MLKWEEQSLNTIRFYIILKPKSRVFAADNSLNTIRFYIILKQAICHVDCYKSLNTIRFYIILKRRSLFSPLPVV